MPTSASSHTWLPESNGNGGPWPRTPTLASGFRLGLAWRSGSNEKVPLTWKDRACLGSYQPRVEGTFAVKNSARGARVSVSADGRGLVSQAGLSCCGKRCGSPGWPGACRRGWLGGGSRGRSMTRGRSSRTWRRPWRWAVTAWRTSRCCGSSRALRDRSRRTRWCPGWSACWLATRAGAESDPGRAGGGARARLGACRGRRARRGQRPGRHRPGRDDRGRPLGEGAGRSHLEEDLRVPPDDRLGRPRRGRERGAPRDRAEARQCRLEHGG